MVIFGGYAGSAFVMYRQWNYAWGAWRAIGDAVTGYDPTIPQSIEYAVTGGYLYVRTTDKSTGTQSTKRISLESF